MYLSSTIEICITCRNRYTAMGHQEEAIHSAVEAVIEAFTHSFT